MKPIFRKNREKADNITKFLSSNLTLDPSVFKDVLRYGFILGNKTPLSK